MTWEFANQVSSVYTLNVVINHSSGLYQRSVYGIYKHPNSKNHFRKQTPVWSNIHSVFFFIIVGQPDSNKYHDIV